MFKKTLRAFLALTLAAILCLGSMITVFAADPETDTSQAAITKLLKVPEGTNLPASMPFKFNVTKVSVDGDDSGTATATMPAIGTAGVVTINFASPTLEDTSGGLSTYYLESADLFTASAFPHAGLFVYTIKEDEATSYPAGTGETVSYSKAEYTITVYVKDGVSGLEIDAIGVLKTKDDAGDTVGGEKVDPKPGEGSGDPGDYSDLAFTNTYIKTNTGEDPTDDDDVTLSVSKTVAGEYGAKTKYFPFSLTLTKAALVTGAPTYKAYVLDETDTVVTSASNFGGTIVTGGAYGPYFEVTAGAPAVTVNLKHDQRLVFVGTPVGTRYAVTETGTPGYTPKVKVTVDGDGAIPELIAGEGASLSTDDATTGARVIGEDENSAAFTNTYKSVTPTGIALDNLPFLMMIVLAAGAFVAFIIVKSRKRAYNQ